MTVRRASVVIAALSAAAAFSKTVIDASAEAVRRPTAPGAGNTAEDPVRKSPIFFVRPARGLRSFPV